MGTAVANTVALPGAVIMKVNEGSITLPSAPAKSGNTYYKESIKKGLRFEGNPEAVLNGLSFAVGDVTLKAGEVHVSNPTRYGPRHAKSGQEIRGTGGNLTVTGNIRGTGNLAVTSATIGSNLTVANNISSASLSVSNYGVVGGNLTATGSIVLKWSTLA